MSSNITLTTEQQEVVKILLGWFENRSTKKQYITLGGYAGTGKTTLLSYLRQKLNEQSKKAKNSKESKKSRDSKDIKVAFCSFTGKAVQVLKDTLKVNKGIYKQDNISTIHSLIYSPLVNAKEEIIGWERRDKLNFDLIIADEASMIPSDLWKDLLAFRIPIIAVGDHGQLPPINSRFNLMEKPELKLEKIHRQAEENPIIHLSILARESGEIPFGNFGKGVMRLNKYEQEAGELVSEILMNYDSDTLVLCGYNFTRQKLNSDIRKTLGFDSPTPLPGDRVICLRNNHIKQIYNGMMGYITYISEHDEDNYYVEVEWDSGEKYTGMALKEQFGNTTSINFSSDRSKSLRSDLFDFAYAVTVHKAQGSQSRRVVLFEERFKQMTDEEWRRWLYTAITRAQEELYIIGV